MVSQFVAFTTPQVLPRTSKMENSAAFHRKGNRGSPDVWFGSEDCGVTQACFSRHQQLLRGREPDS